MELGRLAQDARGAARQGWFRSILSSLRFWRTAAGTREIFALVPARFMFTPWTLTVAFFGLIGSVVEIAAAPFAALWLLVAVAL